MMTEWIEALECVACLFQWTIPFQNVSSSVWFFFHFQALIIESTYYSFCTMAIDSETIICCCRMFQLKFQNRNNKKKIHSSVYFLQKHFITKIFSKTQWPLEIMWVPVQSISNYSNTFRYKKFWIDSRTKKVFFSWLFKAQLLEIKFGTLGISISKFSLSL